MNQSSALPKATTRVVGIPQMVCTNLITTTHVNMIANRPLMSLMAIGRCKSTNVVHLRGGYWEPIDVTTLILGDRDGHYVRPNMVTFKYPNFKKDVDLDVHIKVFNSTVKANVETSKEYISSMHLAIC